MTDIALYALNRSNKRAAGWGGWDAIEYGLLATTRQTGRMNTKTGFYITDEACAYIQCLWFAYRYHISLHSRCYAPWLITAREAT